MKLIRTPISPKQPQHPGAKTRVSSPPGKAISLFPQNSSFRQFCDSYCSPEQGGTQEGGFLPPCGRRWCVSTSTRKAGLDGSSGNVPSQGSEQHAQANPTPGPRRGGWLCPVLSRSCLLPVNSKAVHAAPFKIHIFFFLDLVSLGRHQKSQSLPPRCYASSPRG